MAYTPKQREAAIAAVIDGLRKGTPLTVICSAEGMPCDRTIRDWADADEALSSAIARARDAGFDAIAMEALRIADTPVEGVEITEGEDGTKTKRADMLGHRKLQVETRLKLLAKWDPKRYGDATLLKHGDADGNNLDLANLLAARRAKVAGAE